jgi:hypothetical protein
VSAYDNPPSKWEASEASAEAYKKGFEDGKPKWISVKDRLPEKDGKYLVHKNLWGTSYISTIRFAQDGERVCKHDLARKKNVWYDYDSETGYFSVDTVTHWMPLPEAPKENDDG